MTQRAATTPTLTADDITIHTDKLGREVVLVPEAIVEWLDKARGAGWVEVVGMAYGESKRYEPGSDVDLALRVILTAVQAWWDDDDNECEGHESLRGDSMGASFYCDGSCRNVALRDARAGSFYGFVTARAWWNPETAWWVDGPALSVSSLHVDPRGAHFSG